MELTHETLQDTEGNSIEGIEFEGSRFDSMAVIQDSGAPVDFIIRAKRNDGHLIECGADVTPKSYQGITIVEGTELPIEMRLGLEELGYTTEHSIGVNNEVDDD